MNIYQPDNSIQFESDSFSAIRAKKKMSETTRVSDIKFVGVSRRKRRADYSSGIQEVLSPRQASAMSVPSAIKVPSAMRVPSAIRAVATPGQSAIIRDQGASDQGAAGNHNRAVTHGNATAQQDVVANYHATGNFGGIGDKRAIRDQHAIIKQNAPAIVGLILRNQISAGGPAVVEKDTL
jgi:hypothetical protein